MSEAIRYYKLADHFDDKNLQSSDRRTATRAAYVAVLLEQIRLKDKLISDFRSFLLSWDVSVAEHADTERWERAKRNLLQSAAETLEGVDEAE